MGAAAPLCVFVPTAGDAHSGHRHILAKDGAGPIFVGERTIPVPVRLSRRDLKGRCWRVRVGNGSRAGGGLGWIALSFTASQNLLDHRTCLSRSAGKSLPQERCRFGMATARKEQSAQILGGLCGIWIKLKSYAKAAFRILKLFQRDLHGCPVVPKPCRGGLGDCVGENLRGCYKFLLLIKRLRSLEDIVD